METNPTINMIASAQHATALIASEPHEPQAQSAFMRELGLSELDHFAWFYLLTTLLALKDQPQANAALPQVACAASAKG